MTRTAAELKAPAYGCPSTVVAPYSAVFHLATSQRQVDKLVAEFGDGLDAEGLVHGTGGCTSILDTEPDVLVNFHVVVYLDVAWFAGKPLGFLVGTLAHECTHAAGFIAHHYGLNTDPREEHVAYLLDWLVTWAWDRLPGRTLST